MEDPTLRSFPSAFLDYENVLQTPETLYPSLYPEIFPDVPSLAELADAMTAGDRSGHVRSNEDQIMLDIVVDHLNSAEESSRSQVQYSPFTGGAAAASDFYTLPAGMAVTSHCPSIHSTQRATLDTASGGSSRSPGTTSQILTPTSTLLDYNASLSDCTFLEDDETDDNLSPTSDGSYAIVSHPHRPSYPGANLPRPQIPLMSNHSHQQASSSQGSGASDVQHMSSRASSLAPSIPGAQWGSLHAPGATFIDNQHAQQVARDNASYYIQNSYPPGATAFTSSGQAYSDGVIPDLTATDMFDAPMPFRPAYDQQVFQQTIYGAGSNIPPGFHQTYLRPFNQTNPAASQQPQHHQHVGQQHGMHNTSSYPTQLIIPTTGSLLVQPQENPLTAPPKMEHIQSSPSPMQNAPQFVRRSIHAIPSQSNSPYPQPASRPDSQHPERSQNRLQYPTTGTRGQPAPSVGTAIRPLQAARARHTLQSNASRASSTARGRKGGRQKGDHLDEDAKKKSGDMRKLVACWRCAMQRDSCDSGAPCKRCFVQARKGHVYFFPCDRSKLPDLVHDFLPAQATMTLMHQKQTIEDTVADQVVQWDIENPITVYLTSGYGPPLRWSLHEFKPRTDDLLGQYQYLQNPRTGREERYHKYSPPFGLLKLDATDDTYLGNYLTTLLNDEYLEDLGWTFFEEESQVDANYFQARLVDAMCTLYLETKDTDLKDLLKEVLRMLIITYIMSHTLTICQETLPSVLDAIKYSPKFPHAQHHTSPRLANRQLKFYFSVFRSNIYEKILKWQQQTLHTSGKKSESWLLSFCAMLGFAMVLEEVQRTIMIQADAKTVKHEATWEQASTEASNACERIDERFKLLVGLFQCKYRDKKWDKGGSFGNQTPRLSDPSSHKFLKEVRELLELNTAHLQSRQNVQFAVENQCQYTSRLVARFLLPFLTLPA